MRGSLEIASLQASPCLSNARGSLFLINPVLGQTANSPHSQPTRDWAMRARGAAE